MPPARPNFIFRVTLRDIVNPTIFRLLSVPAGLNFHEFHLILQTAFGWKDIHMYEFSVRGPEATYNAATGLFKGEILFDIQEDPEPPFSMPGYPDPPPCKRSRRVKLFEVFDTPRLQVDYTYDLGDCREHMIEVVGREPRFSARRSACLDGEGHPCAEDSGSEWEAVKNAYQSPNPTADQISRRNWYETRCTNGDPKGLSGDGPYRWDIDQVNLELYNLAAFGYKPEYYS